MAEAGLPSTMGKIKANKAFFKRNGISYASQLEHSIFPDSTLFDNTRYHLNYAGVQMNTQRLIREIRRLQENPQQ